MRDLLPEGRPVLVLAPMQAVTDLPFMRVMQRYGGPDLYVTEYFRVYENAILKKEILRSIDENPTGRPVFAQMIGQHVPSLVRLAKELEQHAVAGVDLNLGCPAPVVCRKAAGGALLRDLQKLDRILGALREAVEGRFTVKTRVGYDSPQEFEALLEIFRKHEIDALAIHGRTVVERYQTPVHPDCVRQAVEAMDCPVIANGNVVTVATGQAYLARTGAAGLMVGRGAIRNPWLFDQLRAAFGALAEAPRPTGRDLLGYIRALWEETRRERGVSEEARQVHMMKRYLCYITQGLDPAFDYKIRRVSEEAGFFGVCGEYLEHDEVLPDEPPEASKRFCGFGKLLGGG